MLSCPHSLHLSIQSPHISGSFKGLVDSGSSVCFVDSNFVVTNRLTCQTIAPLPVALIDGTVNAFVTQSVSLPIGLACSYTCTLELFVTELERTFPVVLGHSWLVKHNPKIDWKTGTVQFSTLKPLEKNPRTKTEPQIIYETSLKPSPNCPKIPHTPLQPETPAFTPKNYPEPPGTLDILHQRVCLPPSLQDPGVSSLPTLSREPPPGGTIFTTT